MSSIRINVSIYADKLSTELLSSTQKVLHKIIILIHFIIIGQDCPEIVIFSLELQTYHFHCIGIFTSLVLIIAIAFIWLIKGVILLWMVAV